MNSNTNKDYYAIYSRKSKFTGKGESIENQVDMCKQYLINRYGNNNIKIYQDEGFTGYNTNRPQFQIMLKDIENRKIKCVIVYRLDRISRNVTDFCNLKNIFEKYGVSFISITENFDTSTPMGSAMIMISSVFAQLERDTIAERIKDNMLELAKTGRWLGGTTPLGYNSIKKEFVSLDHKKRHCYQLVINEEEAFKVKLIWDKMDELGGISKLESYLLQLSIKTRNNNDFTRFSLMTILKNPVYVKADIKIKNFFKKLGANIYARDEDFDGKRGLIAYNKSKEKSSKTKVMKSVDEWVISVGEHEGIIDSSMFIKVWNNITSNQNKRFRRPLTNTSLLSGIIYCKQCGSYMRPKLRNTYINDKRNFIYLCQLKEKSRKKLCNCKNINGVEIDNSIINNILDIRVPKLIVLDKLKDMINTKTPKKGDEIKQLEVLIIKNENKIKKLIEKLVDIDLDVATDVTNKIKELKKTNYNLKRRVIANNNKLLSMKHVDIKEQANNILKNYKSAFNNLDLVKKRSLMRLVISKIDAVDNNIYINYGCNCP